MRYPTNFYLRIEFYGENDGKIRLRLSVYPETKKLDTAEILYTIFVCWLNKALGLPRNGMLQLGGDYGARGLSIAGRGKAISGIDAGIQRVEFLNASTNISITRGDRGLRRARICCFWRLLSRLFRDRVWGSVGESKKLHKDGHTIERYYQLLCCLFLCGPFLCSYLASPQLCPLVPLVYPVVPCPLALSQFLSSSFVTST